MLFSKKKKQSNEVSIILKRKKRPQIKNTYLNSSHLKSDCISLNIPAYVSAFKKRVFSFAFPYSGSVTIEAAICLSIFLFAMLTLLSFGTVMNQRMRMSAPLRNTCSKIAQNYAVYNLLETDAKIDEILSEFSIKSIGLVGARELFIKEAGEKNLNKSCIVNGVNGISFVFSDIPDENDYIDLIITYRLRLPFRIITIPDMKIVQRSRIHAWSGTILYHEENSVSYVYVTRKGSVYHKDLSCKHLNIVVRKALLSNIYQLRNKSGAKYYACEICDDVSASNIVYVTDYGTAYHRKPDCFTISRNAIRVPVTDVVGKEACSNCGQ